MFEKFKTTICRLNDKRKIFFAKAEKYLWRTKLPITDGNVYVNLGCGMTNHPKFINVDAYPYPHVHFVHRIDHLPMFTDDSVDLVYASHCLEHFKHYEITQVLNEWVRILKPGGVLRLSVPDFDKLIEIYSDTGNPDDFVSQLMGGQDNRYNCHYSVFNMKNLAKYLERSCCVDIKEWSPGDSDLTTFDDFSVYQKDIEGQSYKISLNIEARKAYQ